MPASPETKSSETLTFRFDKLIRDKILNRMLEEGSTPKYRRLVGVELITALRNKLVEESRELNTDNPDELVDELADLQEVVDTFTRLEPDQETADYQGLIEAKLKEIELSRASLRTVQEDRRLKHGGFDGGIYLETIEIAADNSWVEHFQANPDRYPLIGTDNARTS